MPKLKDVALAAQVSPSTVSRYLNGSLTLPAHTAARIDAAIAQLNYIPNAFARSLTGHNPFIGVIVPEIENPFWSRIFNELIEELTRAKLRAVTLLATPNQQTEREAIEMVRRRHLKGLLICSAYGGDLPRPSSPLPIVTLMEPLTHFEDFANVRMEDYGSGVLAAEHLFALGHRETAVIGGASQTVTATARVAGFCETMTRLGAPAPLVRQGPYTAQSGAALAREILESPQPPTGLFATSDTLATGIYKAAYDLGIAIPQVLSVIGCHNVPITEFFTPPLTTIEHDFRQVAFEAISLLKQQIQGIRPADLSVKIAPRLITRASTQALPAAK